MDVKSRLYRFLKIYLFWLHVWALSSCGNWELLFVWRLGFSLWRLLIAEDRLQGGRLSAVAALRF